MNDFKELPAESEGSALYRPSRANPALCFHVFEIIVRPDAPIGFVAQTVVKIAMDLEGFAVGECDAASE